MEKLFLNFLSLSGFLISLYIYFSKNKKKPLICPLKSNCEKVINSDYSKFLGIPVEILGIGYYFLIFSISLITIIDNNFFHLSIFSIIFGLTILALLFSLYLTFVQLFVLKELCTWCLLSALISSVIFALSSSAYNYNLIQFLTDNYKLIILLHAVFSAVGLGAATTTDFLFIRFLKDFKISEKEKETLDFVSQLIWFSLGIILLSGIGIYLTRMAELHQSAKFLVKNLIILIIIINGLFLNFIISPYLIKISFNLDINENNKKITKINALRKLAFALSAVSIISWYYVFILGEIPKLSKSFSSLIIFYFITLGIGIIFSQLLEIYYSRKFLKNFYLINYNKNKN